ncbi:hypothetical protein FKM82_005651 [Ascaphus truei]
MNLLFIALSLSVLGFTGWALKTPEKVSNSTGLLQTVQMRDVGKPNLREAIEPSRAQTASKHSPIRQDKASVAKQNRPGVGNTLVAGRGQCLVHGMVMHDGAAWSPQPCTVCICDRGTRVCEPADCAEVPCAAGRVHTPPGACCPVCVRAESPQLKAVASTPKASQEIVKERKNKREEKQKGGKVIQGKEGKVRTAPQPVKGPPTAKQASTPSKGQQSRRKGTDGDRQVEGPPRKKEAPYGKQETLSQKKNVSLGKATKASNKEREPDTEDPKKPELEQARKEKTKQREAWKGSAQHRGAGKPLKDQVPRNKKSDVADSVIPAPTAPSVRPSVPPTDSFIPSLPSGCLLAESTIACANTQMKYLPLMTDPGLKTLYLAENEISKLPARAFSGLPNLEWLDLSKNQLGDSGLSFDVFRNLTKLRRLNLDGNRLTALPLLPPSLQELKINDNDLQELHRHSFRGLNNLLTLQLEGNSLHDGNVYPLTFKPLKKLIYLRMDRNHFRAIPSGLPASLQELHLDNNRIEVVSEGILNKTLNLSVLVLSNNRLQEDRIAPRAWIDLLNLESLDLSHNRLVHVPSFLPRGLQQLIMHHNQIERIPGYVFAHLKPGLEFLHLSHNHLSDSGIHAVSFFGLYKSLNELLLDNNLLPAIPRGILSLKSLQVLRLSFNKIRYVPLNSICDTRVSEDSNLISVHLENNFIDRRLIPPTAFSCIKTYHSVVLRPQQEEYEDY